MDERVDLGSVAPENFWAGYVLELPFRLRVGAYHHQVVQSGRHEIQLALLNRLDVPDREAEEAALCDDHVLRTFRTTAVALLPMAHVSEAIIEMIKHPPEGGERHRVSELGAYTGVVIDAVNNFVVAYSHAAREWFGGSPLRLLHLEDYLTALTWELTLVLPAGCTFERDDYIELTRLQPTGPNLVVIGELEGELHDLSPEILLRIPDRLGSQEKHIHFELAFEARSRMISHDFRGGLLLAVAALESAHATIVQACFSNRFPKELNPSTLADNFLRELGMTRALQITPYLLLEDGQQPDPALIANCVTALNRRNEIMHALRTRSGEYKARLRSSQELSRLTVAALDLTDFFVATAERLRSKVSPLRAET